MKISYVDAQRQRPDEALPRALLQEIASLDPVVGNDILGLHSYDS